MVVHKMRDSAKELAIKATRELANYNIEVISVDDLECNKNMDFELILVLGGDGSILSSAHYAREYNVPLIGINLGHVGFLAEMNPEDISTVVEKIANKDYTIETRTTIEIRVQKPDGTIEKNWALNEAALIRKDNLHPAYLSVGIDGEPISTFGCDGVIFATPTGSTAYAFSVGGPVVWPGVDALVLVPLAAHALFTRPLIVSSTSKLQVSVLPNQWDNLTICCDGIRTIDVPEGSQICAIADKTPIQVARMNDTPFSARLVAKFNLPVNGWRESSTNTSTIEKKNND